VLRVLLAALALATPPSVTLATKPAATVGVPWTAALVVRGTSAPVVTARSGTASISARSRAAGRRHRVRLVFPQAGTWTLTARAGRRTFALGSVRVSNRPLTLDRAAQMIVDGDTLLVVETGRGRVLRVDPRTGRTSVFTRGLTAPFGIARSPDGNVFVSDGTVLWRVESATGVKQVHARIEAGVDLGPVAVDAQGRVYVATSARDVRRFDAAGRAEIVMPDVAVAHGLVFAHDGALLVSDTERDRLLRYEPATGASSVFATGLRGPGGLDVAQDGSVYVCEFGSGAQRVSRIDPSGTTSIAAQGFVLPIAVATARDGAIYVDDSTGRIYRLVAGGPLRVRLFAP
jgi:sugar lactone lactonase YvrE